MSSLRALFGGAVRLELPARLADASALRDVPDNQEVFAAAPADGAAPHAPSPLSLVVEVLERVAAVDAGAGEGAGADAAGEAEGRYTGAAESAGDDAELFDEEDSEWR